eukprot:CAMPEP_0172480132 /NCGR_PEP_ID=MMETSP1066-20121228/5097_1 /TAXON_ID=671091 /ORGANISM="Coscinodiscus wailesii, Strain CCMP2513" /LENGTH=481 /DNA_ID=CAMNT_0013241183 /DNA_START=124 /DNA_END=1569 /DNA_ORIENTATION=-
MGPKGCSLWLLFIVTCTTSQARKFPSSPSLLLPKLRQGQDPTSLRYDDSDKNAPIRGGSSNNHNSPTLKFIQTYLAYSSIYLARKPVSIVKSTLESELGLTRSQLGAIDTSLLGSYAIGQILLGQTVKRLGRITPVAGAYALCGLFTALFGTLSHPSQMALLWGVCGFGAAAVNPLLVLYVADLYPASLRASMVGLWQTSQQVGGIVSNGVASYVLVKMGWRAVFFVSGAIVAAFALPLWITLRDGGERKEEEVVEKKTTGEAVTTSSMSPFNVPGAVSVGIAYTLTKMTRYCLMMWLPYFLTQHVGMGPASSGIISTVFDVTGATGSILSGALVDKVLNGRMIFVTLPACILSAVSFILWGVLGAMEGDDTKSVALHVGMMGLVGFLIAGPDGILGGAASRNLVDYAGLTSDKALPASVSGMVNGCGSIGAILQGTVTAKLVDSFGWSGLFYALGISMTIASLSLLDAVRVENKAINERK